jgi:hypothetical protein
MNNTKRELTAFSVDDTRFSREFDDAAFTVTPEPVEIAAAPCDSKLVEIFRKAAARAKEVF